MCLLVFLCLINIQKNQELKMNTQIIHMYMPFKLYNKGKITPYLVKIQLKSQHTKVTAV